MRVHEAVEQAIAEEYVRLQGSSLQQLLNASAVAQQGLDAAIEVYAEQAEAAYQAAGEQAAQFLYDILRVSTERPLESVLRQPDVQAVLHRPFERAAASTREAISQAWQEGAAQGHGAANRDLGIVGIDPVDPVPIDQEALNRLLDDADRNGDAAYQRFRNAITSMDPDVVRESVRHVARDQARRARAGADVAGKFAANNARLWAWDQRGVTHKVWVASLSPVTCRYCLALHGKRQRLWAPFPTAARFGGGARLPWWGDRFTPSLPMLEPPRHIHCRCRLIPWGRSVVKDEDEEGPTLSDMLAMALEWFYEFFRHPTREV
jgi:hypothetical protein